MSTERALMFKKQTLKDFLSWEHLDFTFPQGVTLLEGYNFDDDTPEGCGKSAILNGLTWIAYGKIPKEVTVSDIIREGSKKAEGELTLLQGHRIVRTRTKSSGTLQLFLPDGKEYIGKDTNATQAYINEVLGMTYETFLQSVYFAQNYEVKFITSDEKLRVKVLSDIAELSVFDKAIKETTGMMKSSKESKTEITTELEDFQRRLETKKENLYNLKRYKAEEEAEKEKIIEKLEDDFSDQEKESEDLIKFLEDTTEEGVDAAVEEGEKLSNIYYDKIMELEKVLSSADNITDKIEHLEKAIKTNERHTKNIKSQISSKEHEIEVSENKIGRLVERNTKQTETIEVKISKLSRKIERLQNPEDPTCPTCGTELEALEEGHFDKEIKELKEEQQEYAAQQKDLEENLITEAEARESEVKILEKEIKESKKELKNSKKEAEKLIVELETVELPDFSDVEAKLRELRKAKINTGHNIMELKSLKKDIKRAVEDLSKIEVKMKTLDQDIEKAKKKAKSKFDSDIKKTKKEIKENESKVESLENLLEEGKEELKELTKLREGFKETKAYTFKALLRDLTNKSKYYLGQLFNLPISIEFTNETEEGGIAKITDKVTIGNVKRPFALYSGGQARRIQLAVDLALSDIVAARGDKPAKLLIMDEYCKDLSESSMEKVLELFENLDKSVIMIEHNSLIKNIVSNTFQIELRDGVSRCL